MPHDQIDRTLQCGEQPSNAASSVSKSETAPHREPAALTPLRTPPRAVPNKTELSCLTARLGAEIRTPNLRLSSTSPSTRISPANEGNTRDPTLSRIPGEQILSSYGCFYSCRIVSQTRVESLAPNPEGSRGFESVSLPQPVIRIDRWSESLSSRNC